MKQHLKSYITHLIEAAVGGDQAIESGLALYRGQREGKIYYVLYEPKTLASVMQEPGFWSMRFSKPLDEFIYGFIEAIPHSDECNDAIEVHRSAASKGYGPLMYDIVMSDGEGGLMPDRVSTNSSAEKLWQYYSSKRSDVDKKPFDDRDDPKTPEECDDCELVKDPNKVLNYSYDGPGQSASKSSLMQRHSEVAQQMAKHDVKQSSLENVLYQLGNTYFDKKYGR